MNKKMAQIITKQALTRDVKEEQRKEFYEECTSKIERTAQKGEYECQVSFWGEYYSVSEIVAIELITEGFDVQKIKGGLAISWRN